MCEKQSNIKLKTLYTSSQLSVVIWSETVGDAAGTETKVIKASQIEGHDNLYDLFCVTMHVLSNYSSH